MLLPDLEKQFQKACEKAATLSDKIPSDIKLRLYAYYKQATKGDPKFSYQNDDTNVVDAFKLNAWVQIKGMNEKEAKEKYIELINHTCK